MIIFMNHFIFFHCVRLLLLFSDKVESNVFFDPMDCSMPGFPILHYLPEFVQTHVHWVGNAIQLYHPVSPPSLSALSLSQHQGVFQSGGQSIGASASSSVLAKNIPGWFPLGLTDLISLLRKGSQNFQHHNLRAPILWCSAFFMCMFAFFYIQLW